MSSPDRCIHNHSPAKLCKRCLRASSMKAAADAPMPGADVPGMAQLAENMRIGAAHGDDRVGVPDGVTQSDDAARHERAADGGEGAGGVPTATDGAGRGAEHTHPHQSISHTDMPDDLRALLAVKSADALPIADMPPVFEYPPTDGAPVASDTAVRWLDKLSAHSQMCPTRRDKDSLCTCGVAARALNPGGVREVGLVKLRDALPDPRTMPNAERGTKDTRKPAEKFPLWLCHDCGWQAFGTDVSHRCAPPAVKRLAEDTSLAAQFNLTSEQRMSAAYRIAIMRDAGGTYSLVEEWRDEKGDEHSFVLQPPDGFDFIYARMLDECVEKMTP